MLPASLAAASEPHAAVRLIEQLIATSHGYASLYLAGFFGSGEGNDLEDYARLAASTIRQLAATS